MPFILLIGIPHGAIDNILYLKNSPISNVQFISFYLIVIVINLAIWVVIPIVGYLIFLLISAYHFGQSQFSHYFYDTDTPFKLLSFSWGVSILSGLIYFNSVSISQLGMVDSNLFEINWIHTVLDMKVLLIVSTLLTLLLILQKVLTKKLSLEHLFMEVIVLAIILTTFYLLPLLVSFSLYFIILHSYKVLKEEYNFLKDKNVINNITGFIKILAPLTILSLVGILLVFYLIANNWLPISYGYALFLIISSITLPHVFVMNRFYKFIRK